MEYGSSNPQNLEAPTVLAQATAHEATLALSHAEPSHRTTPATTDAASPVAAQAVETMEHSVAAAPHVETGLPVIEITSHAAFEHHTPDTVGHQAAASLATPHAYIPTHHAAPVDLTHLFQPEPNPLWSSVSGWGEINVSQALNNMGQHPSSANDTANGSTSNTPAHLSAMGFDTAWHNGFTGQGVVVADIDTGIDLTNQALMQGLHLDANSWNFLNNSSNVQDDNGHGTMTALEIGANDKVGANMEGGAYGAQVMVLKAMDANGQGSTHVIGEAIHYAVGHGASVINLSLGSNASDLNIQNAMQYAYDQGVIVVAAAGNEGSSAIDFPAAYSKVLPNVIAVGASDQAGAHDVLASFSNQAGSSNMYNFVDAIGTHITGYGLNGDLVTWSGTSMASPLVAAEAAILKSANPQLSAYEIVQDILHATNSLDNLLNQFSATNANSPTTSSQAPIQIASVSAVSEDALSHYANADFLHASSSYVPTEQYHG